MFYDRRNEKTVAEFSYVVFRKTTNGCCGKNAVKGYLSPVFSRGACTRLKPLLKIVLRSKQKNAYLLKSEEVVVCFIEKYDYARQKGNK